MFVSCNSPMFRAFELPEFPAALEFPTAASEKLKDTFDSGQLRRIAATKRWEYQVERNAKGFVESVCSFLGMKYYETRERYDVEGFKADLANVMSENAQKALSEVSEGALESQIRELTSFVGQLYEQRQQYEGDYQQIFTSYLEMLNLVLDDTNEHKEAVQKDIETFMKLGRITEGFFTLFDEVVQVR